jgi:hypothetical protein
MKKPTAITAPTAYHGYILVPCKGGMDLIDPSTGRWARFPTQRYAKWSATFITNITARFDAHIPLPAHRIPTVEVPEELT